MVTFPFGLSHPVFAQSADTGALSGTVKDHSGAVLSAARISVINNNTGVTRALTTNNPGFYSAEALPSGDYTILIQRAGFETGKIENIHLDPGQRAAPEHLWLQSWRSSANSEALQLESQKRRPSSSPPTNGGPIPLETPPLLM
jgi:hypothetical protein